MPRCLDFQMLWRELGKSRIDQMGKEPHCGLVHTASPIPIGGENRREIVFGTGVSYGSLESSRASRSTTASGHNTLTVVRPPPNFVPCSQNVL